MRKISFCFYITLCFLLPACKSDLESDEEKIEVILPSWDYLTNSAAPYPPLSRWKIKVSTAQKVSSFYLPAQSSSFTITPKVNSPLSITACPITLLSDGSETQFFKPAGAVYPHSLEVNDDCSSLCLTLFWEEGFTADIIEKLIEGKNLSGTSASEMEKFLMEFNWKKFQQKIISNGEKSSEDSKFYNPWQIDTSTLLDNLSFATFDSNYQKTKYIYSVNLESINLPQSKILSSYIPENDIIEKLGLIFLKKKTPQTFLIDNTYGARLTATSSKKVSADYTYMPIYIEDYAHSE